VPAGGRARLSSPEGEAPGAVTGVLEAAAAAAAAAGEAAAAGAAAAAAAAAAAGRLGCRAASSASPRLAEGVPKDLQGLAEGSPPGAPGAAAAEVGGMRWLRPRAGTAYCWCCCCCWWYWGWCCCRAAAAAAAAAAGAAGAAAAAAAAAGQRLGRAWQRSAVATAWGRCQGQAAAPKAAWAC